MIGATLSWFGRMWVGVAVVCLLNIDSVLSPSLADRWLFYSGWMPRVAVPGSEDTVWWIALVILALPGIIAVILGDTLRKRRAARVSRLACCSWP
jgi:hypothetical protein